MEKLEIMIKLANERNIDQASLLCSAWGAGCLSIFASAAAEVPGAIMRVACQPLALVVWVYTSQYSCTWAG